MTQPIPSYLLALAVGDLEFRPLGERAGVYAEPAMVAQGRLGVRRHGEDDRRRRAALRPLPLGALRPARAAAELSVRRHGESPADLRHADDPRRRPLAGRAGGARARPLLVGESGDQRDLERLLAQRGLHGLFREPDHGGALRPRLLGDAGTAVEARARGGAARSRSRQPRDLAVRRPRRPRSGRRPGRDRLRQGLLLPARPRGDGRPRDLGPLSPRLLREARLRLDDDRRLRRLPAAEPARRRSRRGAQGRSPVLGLRAGSSAGRRRTRNRRPSPGSTSSWRASPPGRPRPVSIPWIG